MSYEIVKSIKVRNGAVYITSTSNNVRPRIFREWLCDDLGHTLNALGEDAFNLEILKAYEEGNFQEGVSNKFSRAIKVLRNSDEYKKFNWRLQQSKFDENGKYIPDEIEIARNSKEFDSLLLSSLSQEYPKTKFTLTKKDYEGNTMYLLRMTSRMAKWTYDKTKAKKYSFRNCNTKYLKTQ